MLVDFHVHSTASDGTFTPTELAARAAAGKFRALALTDHDNCDGVVEFMSAPTDMRRIAGIELSIEPGRGFDKFHLLGLGIDPANAALVEFQRRILEGRNRRNAQIVENFRRLGIEMATGGDDDISRYAHGAVLAKPHFGRWLMDHGYVKSVLEGFNRYLLADSPPETRCFVERYHPSQEEAFAVVHAAGGLCVMAHPKYWRDEWKSGGCDFAAAERALAELKEKGLDGVEALYQANRPEEDVGFTRIAARLGLVKSAGSDFHGLNKPTIPLGMDVDEAFISPLLERLGAI